MNKPASKIHPLVATAAIAVVVVSVAGTASLMGWLPSRQTSDAPAGQTTVPSTPTTDAASVTTTAPAAANTTPSSQSNQSAAPAMHARSTKPQPSHNSAAPVNSTAPTQAQSSAPAQAAPVCMDCGKVITVRTVEQATKPSGVGAVAGAVVGGVLGNQIGGGSGKTLATVAGAVGGGMAGNEIEKRTHKITVYEVDVLMDNGSRQSFRYEQSPGWREGDKVRVSNGGLIAR
jgi:outer membrane lipoprotein SlyB